MPSDAGILINYNIKIIILIYINDLLVFGPILNNIENLYINLSKQLELTNLGDVKNYLRIKVLYNRDNRYLKLS